MSKLDTVMDQILDRITTSLTTDWSHGLNVKDLADAYHLLACTKVLTPWTPPKVVVASEINVERT